MPSKDQNQGSIPLLPSEIEKNRQIYLKSIGAEHLKLKTVRQVHGNNIVVINSGNEGVLNGDGLITANKGILLGIITADCVPLLLAHKRGEAVASLHCGWRSTAAGIIPECLRIFREKYGIHPLEIVAAVGPAIRQCCFEIGPDLINGFAKGGMDISKYLIKSSQKGHHMFDLAGQIKKQLVDGGLIMENIEDIPMCTCCDGENFFSFRRDGKAAGRMINVIGIN